MHPPIDHVTVSAGKVALNGPKERGAKLIFLQQACLAEVPSVCLNRRLKINTRFSVSQPGKLPKHELSY